MIHGVANDRGSVRWHQNRWEIRVQVDGRRITQRVKAPNSRAGRRQAEQQLEQLVAAASAGDDTMTVGQVLDRYELLKATTWSPSTQVSHRYHAAPLRDALGGVEVARLRRRDIEAVYERWIGEGSAPATVRRRHAVLAAALRQAERWGVIAVSPARDVLIDAAPRRPADDLPEMVDVLRSVMRIDHRRLRAVAWLAIVTGARRGELVALRWRDLDLDGGQVRFLGSIAEGPSGAVRKATKSGRPKVVAIDTGTVATLREWRAQALEESLEVGHRVDRSSLVFPAPTDPSRFWVPHQVSLMWRRHRDGVGLGQLRFHDLRHLHASHLMEEGVAVLTVSARLGHSSTRMTLDVYGHRAPAGDAAAAAVIGLATETARTS